jgi:hypothetical protein
MPKIPFISFAAITTIGLGLGLLLTSQAASVQVFTGFAGNWRGTLEYKDYGGNGRIKIPVTLTIKPSDAASAVWSFNYDDFGKSVPSFEMHSWQMGQRLGHYRVTMTSKGRTERQSYQSSDFAALIMAGSGSAVLLGSEIEDNKTVEVRRTITLSTTTLVTLKETRAPGQDFAFRNQSSYSRQ